MGDAHGNPRTAVDHCGGGVVDERMLYRSEERNKKGWHKRGVRKERGPLYVDGPCVAPIYKTSPTTPNAAKIPLLLDLK